VKYESRFLAAQREARADGRGVWGKCVTPTSVGSCDPAYPGVCIPPPPPDLDCGDISEHHFTVLPPDPHHFDQDSNGIGCESG
jgi:micrococcal nuclease